MNDAALLVFARCAGFAFRAPGFSHPDVPAPLRAGFAFALAGALAPSIATAAPPAGSRFVFALAAETLVGALVGIAASMLYDGAFSGGRALDDYIGIRASVPSADVAAGAGFGRLWSLAFAAGFFALRGYAPALDALAQTFVTLPPGSEADPAALIAVAVALPATLLRAAFFVAGPAIGVAFAAQFALAALARLVPRFSTFALAFGVAFGCAVVATALALPAVLGSAAHPWMDLRGLRAR